MAPLDWDKLMGIDTATFEEDTETADDMVDVLSEVSSMRLNLNIITCCIFCIILGESSPIGYHLEPKLILVESQLFLLRKTWNTLVE